MEANISPTRFPIRKAPGAIMDSRKGGSVCLASHCAVAPLTLNNVTTLQMLAESRWLCDCECLHS